MAAATSTFKLPKIWQSEEILEILQVLHSDTIVTRCKGTDVYARCLKSLAPCHHLNDDAIVLYLSSVTDEAIICQYLAKQLEGQHPIILAKSYVGKRISKLIKSDTKWIAVPISVDKHWTLMLIQISESKFYYLNSLGNATPYKLEIKLFFETIISRNLTESVIENTPQQHNGYDCGAYIARYFKHIVFNMPLSGIQWADMMEFRYDMLKSIYPDINTQEENSEEYEEQMDIDKVDENIDETPIAMEDIKPIDDKENENIIEETEIVENEEEDSDDDIRLLRELASKSMEMPISSMDINGEIDDSKEGIEDPKKQKDDYLEEIKKLINDDTTSVYSYKQSQEAMMKTSLPFLGMTETGNIITYNMSSDWRNHLRFIDVLNQFTPEGKPHVEGRRILQETLSFHPQVILDWVSKISYPENPFSFRIGSRGNFKILKKIMKNTFAIDLLDPLKTKQTTRLQACKYQKRMQRRIKTRITSF